MNVLIGLLLLLMAFCVYQQWFYLNQIDNLLDRLMARSLQELDHSKKKAPPATPRVKLPPDVPMEDFGRILG